MRPSVRGCHDAWQHGLHGVRRVPSARDRDKQPVMLSALIVSPPFTSGTPPALASTVRTLGALVPATVEGLVRDVTVLSAGDDDGLRTVTEHAGCGLVEAGSFEAALSAAIKGSKMGTVFVIRAGAAFDRGFLDEIAALFGPDRDREATRTFLLRQVPEGLASRLLPDLAPVAGVIAPREHLAGSLRDFAALVRKAGRSRTLASRAQMAF